jgi:hypothetical protein
MLVFFICAVTVFVTVRHVCERMRLLAQQNAEDVQHLLFLSVKVTKLQQLNSKLAAQNQVLRCQVAEAAAQRQQRGVEAWQMLGRGRPSGRRSVVCTLLQER